MGMLLPPHFPQQLLKQEPPAHVSGSRQRLGRFAGVAGGNSSGSQGWLDLTRGHQTAPFPPGCRGECWGLLFHPPGSSPEQEFCLLPQPALVTSLSPAFFPSSEASSQQLLSSLMQFGTSKLVALSFGAERDLHFGVQGDFSGMQSHPMKYELVESILNYVFQILNNYIEGISINYYFFLRKWF